MARLWWRRILLAARIAGAVCVLVATYMLGVWLTAPKFPLSRKFIAVSLNGQPIIAGAPAKFPTLEMRRQSSHVAFEVSGTAHCNSWHGTATLIPPTVILWGSVAVTRMACPALELEKKYLAALLGARRWRTERGTLILENGTDVLRFMLHPS